MFHHRLKPHLDPSKHCSTWPKSYSTTGTHGSTTFRASLIKKEACGLDQSWNSGLTDWMPLPTSHMPCGLHFRTRASGVPTTLVSLRNFGRLLLRLELDSIRSWVGYYRGNCWSRSFREGFVPWRDEAFWPMCSGRLV